MAATSADEQGWAARTVAAIRAGKVPVETYRDPITELGRLAIEREQRAAELALRRAETLRPNPDVARWGTRWGRADG